MAGILALSPGAPAPAHCNGSVFSLGPSDDPYAYIDDRGGDGIWVYLQDNNLPGLQSGGSLGFITDPCHHGNHDRLVAVIPVGI